MQREFDRAAQPLPETGADGPTVGEMLEEVIDLVTGFGVVLLPAFLIAVPGVILFVLLPAILLLVAAAIPVVVAAAVLVPPYLLVRALRRVSSARAPAFPARHGERAS